MKNSGTRYARQSEHMTSRCPHKADRKMGHRYCPACHREYMREWLARRRAARLHAVVVRRVSNVPRETMGPR